MALRERFTHGEIAAFETLFQRHQGEVYRWVVCLIRDPAAAEDLTLETFWRIYRAHARFDAARCFGAWARRIATNLALEYLGKAGREVSAGEDLLNAQPGPPAPDSAVLADTRAALRRAFGDLPVKLKSVARLVLLEQQPYCEVAAALGITVEAVKSREFRAVRLLRKRLKEMGIEL
ncbi:MAG: sigma-70 family RNA polymerase sigma factor [Candidatus Solibacter sp.]|nr:sigma-70 family RNA polymerase sigma factor [Candidatus Solibacter sp.]